MLAFFFALSCFPSNGPARAAITLWIAVSRNSLQFKVSLYLTLVLGATMTLFVVLLVRQERSEQLRMTVDHMAQLSQVIERSTRHAMMLNEPDIVDKIIEDVARAGNVRRVRVLSKDGMIAHSNVADEVGNRINRDAEHCSSCHLGDRPLKDIPNHQKWRLFETPQGEQLLGNMEVIRNDASCANASCHKHPPSQTVLGVVDITYSLAEMNRTLADHVVKMIVVSGGFVILVSVTAGWLLKRMIYVPLADLARGAERLAAGDFNQPIPVRSSDEFGRLARSSNTMMAALKTSHEELADWVRTLEDKVKRRTEELRLAEAEVARGEKLASIGQLAAGIAHELNNPLTGVLTFTSLLRQKMPEGSQDAEDLDLVIRETKRCASIIRRLLDFAREKPPEKTDVDLNELAQETVRFVERSAALQQVTIETDLAPDLPLLNGDGDLIKQVLMNLIVNAQQAITGPGHILVRTRLHPERQMTEVSVTDTGCGIPAANLQRIFEPFFTSKEVGKGTGLGLSVSYGIVKAHGGEIEVESTEGEGSTFRVYLPVALVPEKI
jgi:two-component system NtrC family sensor kinase